MDHILSVQFKYTNTKQRKLFVCSKQKEPNTIKLFFKRNKIKQVYSIKYLGSITCIDSRSEKYIKVIRLFNGTSKIGISVENIFSYQKN